MIFLFIYDLTLYTKVLCQHIIDTEIIQKLVFNFKLTDHLTSD